MKKIFIALALLVFSTLPANAETATGSATGGTDLQNKIKTIVQENLTATEKVLEGKSLAKYTGRTGTIKSVGAKNLTLEVDKDILQVSLGSTDVKPTSLVIGTKIIVLGKITTDNILEAKKITPYTETKPEDLVTTTAIFGKITSIDSKKKTLIINIDNKDLDYALSKKTTVKLEDFQEGDNIFAISKKYQGKLSLSRAVKI